MYFQKSHSLLLFFFYKESHDRKYKQGCKSSNIGQANIEKTDTCSTSAEIS